MTQAFPSYALVSSMLRSIGVSTKRCLRALTRPHVSVDRFAARDTPNVYADTTLAPPSFLTDVYVLIRQRMATLAMGQPRAAHVLQTGHRFEVVRINARVIATEMVQLHAFRDRPPTKPKGGVVRWHRLGDAAQRCAAIRIFAGQTVASEGPALERTIQRFEHLTLKNREPIQEGIAHARIYNIAALGAI